MPEETPAQHAAPAENTRRKRVIPIHPVPGADLPEPERQAVHAAIAAHGKRPGPLLEVLHAVQETLGYIPPRTLPLIAFELNLSRAEVHGVVSFYQELRSAPPAATVLRLCGAEACQAVGARDLEAHARRRLSLATDGTSADGRCTLETVYCLGNCALGPSVMVNGRVHGRVGPAQLDRLLDAQGAKP